MWLPSYHDLPLLISVGSVWMDVSSGRIDNHWLLLGSICGLAAQGIRGGPGQILSGFAAMLIPVFILGWLFIFHMIGAGDIKLLCTLGSFLDPRASILLVLGSLFSGGVLSAFILFHSGIILQRIRFLEKYIHCTIETRQIRPYIQPGVHREENIPFSIPVLFGMVFLCIGGIPS